MDTGKEVGAVFFRFTKVFDSVPHHALLDKLRDLQLNDFIQWICDYLTQRKQRVVVNGQTSETLPVLSGMPQGSVKWPLLFLIYIDGVMDRCSPVRGKSTNCICWDILLYRPITCQGDFAALQEDINKLDSWIEANYLQFNILKCKHMVVSWKRACRHIILTSMHLLHYRAIISSMLNQCFFQGL